MKARVESFERLSDGGMIAHVTWLDDDGQPVLLDHVRLPEWDDLADDPAAQAKHVWEQIAQKKEQVERREAARAKQSQRMHPVAVGLVGAEVVIGEDGTAYVEVVERKRVRMDEYVQATVQAQGRRNPQAS